MRAWKNAAERSGRLLGLALLGLFLIAADAHASGIFVRQAETYLDGDVLRLDADVDLRLPRDVREGLENGLPVTFLMDIQIQRPRDWLWNETLAHLQQRYRLTYLPLSQQYEVFNVNSGARYLYPRLDLALNHIGHPRGLPLMDRRLLVGGARYVGALRVSVDADALPMTLRLLSYVITGWRLESDWYRWPIEAP